MTIYNVYTDDYLQASDHLKKVLQYLSKYKIPASPINYQVWYDIVSERNLPLKRALDQLLSHQNGQLSEQDLSNLFKQFLSQDDQAMEDQRQNLRKIIDSLSSACGQSNNDLTDYLKSLNRFSEALTETGSTLSLAKEVEKIRTDTQTARESQLEFDSQMSSVRQEVEILRQQLEEVREESLTDALTGLSNRKAFDQKVDELIWQNHQEKTEFSLVIADIDFFKKFNDAYGHLAGDKVLKYVSKLIKHSVKGSDFAARFGGEEFTLLLPKTDLDGARIVAEQVRQAIEHKNLVDKVQNQNYGKVTISLGVAQYSGNETAEELLDRADKALYQAKDKGRNRVEVSAH